jgi:YceI-like domain
MSKNSRRNIKTAAAGLVEAMVLLGQFACSHNLLGEQMKTFAAFAVAVVLTQNAVAQHLNLAVDPDASAVNMTLKTNHEVVNGTFQVQSGLIDLDRSDAKISGSVVLAAGSGKTGNDSRDKRMDNDVLRVNQYLCSEDLHRNNRGFRRFERSGERCLDPTRHSARYDNPSSRPYGWVECNGQGPICHSICIVGPKEPKLHDLES